jgi:GNAT superfamily N-acetyltransferase
MATPWVRCARPDEAATVVDIFRDAFPQWLIQRTVYGCGGVTTYVGATIHENALTTPTFLVAGTATAVLAAAEVDVTDDGVFLSYIGTRATARSQGLGSSLLRAAAELSQPGGDSTMTLDVLHENTRAREWYGTIGFEVVGERGWWELELSVASGPAASVSGLSQADICHRAFGFSEVTLHADGRSYRVGRLGTDWFRLTALAALENQKVIAALAALPPRRGILAIGGMDDPASSRLGTPAFRSQRLRAPLTKLRQQLDRAGS